MDMDFVLTTTSLPAAGSVRHFGTVVFLCEVLYLCACVGDRVMCVCVCVWNCNVNTVLFPAGTHTAK